MEPLLIATQAKETVDLFFDTNEESGLYFKRDWNSQLEISELYPTAYLQCFGVNEGSTKKAQHFKAGVITNFDDFRPKSNLPYVVYTKENGQIYQYHTGEDDTYRNCEKIAARLMSEGKEVVLAEEQLKIKTILHTDETPLHPFSSTKTNRDTFIYHSRSKSFSNLISLAEKKSLGLEDLSRWFSMGYATLFFDRRIAYFLFGELRYFEKNPPRDEPCTVYSRTGYIASFKNFKAALTFCQTENSKNQIGCECLICISLGSESWH